MRFITAQPINRQGGRAYKEDYVAYLAQGSRCCWVLADGLGGHGSGDVASKTAVEAVLASFRANSEVSFEAMNKHILAAQQAVLHKQQQESRLKRMRTTLVLVVADQEHFLWGHVGDSRFYHFNQGVRQFQTLDHSVSQALVRAGEIQSGDIRHHEDRNSLLQTLGNAEKLKPTIESEPSLLQPGDSFLLCSDGFWEHVLEEEMEIDYCKSKTPREWLDTMEQRLLAQIHPGEENDNYSALAVFSEWP